MYLVLFAIIAAVFGAQVAAYMRGYRKGYEYARSLVGKDKLPAYDRLHEELP